MVFFPKNKFPIKHDGMAKIKWFIKLYSFVGKTKLISYAMFVIKAIGFLGQTIVIFQSFDDFETLIGIVATYPGVLLAVLKMFFMIIYKERVKYLFETVEKDFWDTSVVNMKLANKLITRLHLITIAIFCHYFQCQTFATLYLLFPFLKIPDGRTRRLPVLIYFPFDTDKSPLHEILTIILGWNLYMSITGNGLYDFLFYYCSQHLCVQFILLKDLLKNLSFELMENADDVEKFRSKHFQKEVRNRFNICVRHHNLLLKYGDELKKYTYWILGIQLFSSFTSLVMTGFVLGESRENMTQFTMLITLLASTSIELSIFAFQSTELSKQSASVAEAAYQCKWYLFNPSIQRGLAFLIMRAKNGIIISAAGLAEMNNEIIVSMYQKVFSCITLLQSLGE